MITIIAVDEHNKQIKINAKSMAVLDIENFVCIDEEAAELLAQALEQNNRSDLSEKVRKLASPIKEIETT